mgnify:CR=1 FL=1
MAQHERHPDLRGVLWAPWRRGYVVSSPRGCFLCKAIKTNAPTVVFRGSRAFVGLNLFPYSNGHLMVMPVRHVGDICRLTESEEREIARLVRLSVRALNDVLRPHGMNIGMNLGRCAGAGLTGHLHIHIVPRWEGDTNFMPVIAGTKVIPQSLDELRDLLSRAFRRRCRSHVHR